VASVVGLLVIAAIDRPGRFSAAFSSEKHLS